MLSLCILLSVAVSVAQARGVPWEPIMRVEYGVSGSNAFWGSQRSGQATNTHSCHWVRAVPSHLTFITRYRHWRKYTEAYGIPIVASHRVSDEAVKRACYIVRFLFADRPDVRNGMYKLHGKVGIAAGQKGAWEDIRDMPTFGDWFDNSRRGLGATVSRPTSIAAEENLRCWRNDSYNGDDISMHEIAHAITELVVRGNGAMQGFNQRLQATYNEAMRRGLWKRPGPKLYAATNAVEYFAEATQSFFDCHQEGDNYVHGPVNTRNELYYHDQKMYNLLREVFPCMNTYSCNCRQPGPIKMDCGGTKVKPKACQDKIACSQYTYYCNVASWKTYMATNCAKTCNFCS